MILAQFVYQNGKTLEVFMCLGIPAKVIELYEANGMKMAKVDFGGVIKEACMEYLPEVKLGDYTIIHVGFGLSILDEKKPSRRWNCSKKSTRWGKQEPQHSIMAARASL